MERLYGLRISGHDDRLLEVLFNEITLVLAGKVHAPAYGELELMTVLFTRKPPTTTPYLWGVTRTEYHATPTSAAQPGTYGLM